MLAHFQSKTNAAVVVVVVFVFVERQQFNFHFAFFDYFVAGAHKVHCSEDQMRVDIGLPADTSASSADRPQIYLEGLKGYPDVRCQPEINGALAVFRLSLSDFYECGVTRMVNQLTVGESPPPTSMIVNKPPSISLSLSVCTCCLSPQGKKVYYHKIIIESASSKEIVSVKCITTSGPVYNVMMNGTNAGREQTRVVLQEQLPAQHHGLVRRDVLPAGFQEPE